MARLGPEKFGNSQLMCTGAQLAEILAAINVISPGMDWYVCDLEVVDSSALLSRSPPAFNNTTTEFAAMCRSVTQFLSGVFFGVSSENKNPSLRIDASTEDSETSELKDALWEVRAFDSSFFEVYCSNRQILSQFCGRFN